jgi:putative oxidoreductase
MRTLTRALCRALLAGIFVFSGYQMFNNSERYAKRAASALPLPDEPMIAKANGVGMMVAGSTFALGILPRLSARFLQLNLLISTYVGHAFWKAEKPEDRNQQLIQFLKNVGLFGGLLLYTSSTKHTDPEPD